MVRLSMWKIIEAISRCEYVGSQCLIALHSGTEERRKDITCEGKFIVADSY